VRSPRLELFQAQVQHVLEGLAENGLVELVMDDAQFRIAPQAGEGVLEQQFPFPVPPYPRRSAFQSVGWPACRCYGLAEMKYEAIHLERLEPYPRVHPMGN
jgi:hypothetical protein